MTPGQVEVQGDERGADAPAGHVDAGARGADEPTVPPACTASTEPAEAGVDRQRRGRSPRTIAVPPTKTSTRAQLAAAHGAAGELAEPLDQRVALVEQLVGRGAGGGGVADRAVEVGDRGGRGVDLLDEQVEPARVSVQAWATPWRPGPRVSVTPAPACRTWVRAAVESGLLARSWNEAQNTTGAR